MKSSRKLIDAVKIGIQIYELGAAVDGLTLQEIRLKMFRLTGVKIGNETLTKICKLNGVKIRCDSIQPMQGINYSMRGNTIFLLHNAKIAQANLTMANNKLN